VVALGAKVVDKANVVLLVGLVVTYVSFFLVGFRSIDCTKLSYVNISAVFVALPVIFTSFSYQGIIPSLVTYLGGNKKMTRQSIIFGTLIPCLVYLMWDGLIKAIAPISMLASAAAMGQTAVEPLIALYPNTSIAVVASFFGFFALTTSFLGVTLGLVDFFKDGLRVKDNIKGSIFVAILVFIPPFIISEIDPTLFIIALRYAGGVGCVTLLGLFPVALAYKLRNNAIESGNSHIAELFGGNLVLAALFVVFIFLFATLTL